MSKLQWASVPLPLCTSYYDISEHLDAKLAALRAYASQYRPVPHIRSEDSVTALATLRGAAIGVRYAEAFEVHRILL
jgi:LmbE family N-acetylglucosaminyl deacetylase